MPENHVLKNCCFMFNVEGKLKNKSITRRLKRLFKINIHSNKGLLPSVAFLNMFVLMIFKEGFKQENPKQSNVNMIVSSLVITLLLILCSLRVTLSSVGDSSPFFHRCVKDCNSKICDTGKDTIFQYNVLGFGISLWSCNENCEYQCQWRTVTSFQNKNWAIPQFKGKWPFIRLFGLQEPASVIFSMFNFFVHLKMITKFRESVPKSSPYYYIWHVYTGVCLNGWFWSSVYHTRDNDFTERMDYMSAFSMVVVSFYTMGLRFMSNSITLKTALWTFFCSSIALNHLAYLWLFNYDYNYNMQLNCVLGFMTAGGWCMWTLLNFPSQPHTWKVALYCLLIVVSMTLELLDFPPLFWLVDAHALWHLATGFIVILFYKFIIDDCIYLKDLISYKAEKFPTKSKTK